MPRRPTATREDLDYDVAAACGVAVATVRRVTRALVAAARLRVARGERLVLRGLATFSLRGETRKTWFNPRTGQHEALPATSKRRRRKLARADVSTTLGYAT